MYSRTASIACIPLKSTALVNDSFSRQVVNRINRDRIWLASLDGSGQCGIGFRIPQGTVDSNLWPDTFLRIEMVEQFDESWGQKKLRLA